MAIADTVFRNGKVVTVDKNFSFKKAIAIKDGWIIDVGEDADMDCLIGLETTVIDLGGKVIMPGACDAHAHSALWGQQALTADCSFPKVSNVRQLQEVIQDKVAKSAPGQWIKGTGIYYDYFDEAKADPNWKISRKDIDPVSPDNPVQIIAASAHSIIVNSKALEIAGVDRHTPDPPKGVIFRDGHGEPTGYLAEFGAQSLIGEHVPNWTVDELKEAVVAFEDVLIRQGTTSYTDAAAGPCGNETTLGVLGDGLIEAHQKLLAEDKKKCRVSIGYYPGQGGAQSYETLKRDLEVAKKWEMPHPMWLKMNLLKLFADGEIIDHTAWMLEDYLDAPGNHGLSSYPGTDEEQAAELEKMIVYAHRKGWQVGVHTVGDRAIKVTTEAMVKAIREYPRSSLRHCVIHGDSTSNRELAGLAARYGIMYSSQSFWVKSYYEASIDALGEERGSRLSPLREIIDAGVIVAGGVDAVSGDYFDWKKSIMQMMSRKSDITGKVYHPELSITLEEGIRMFTINAAYQESEELFKGSIEISKLADLQVLDRDIFNTPVDEIGDIETIMTMVGGKMVYQKEGVTV